MPTVSVIIPTYNRAHLVQDAIESVTKQTFSDYEIVVIDDGSTDATRSIVENFTMRATVKYHFQSNSGLQSVARNVGIAMAEGEYVAFLDSDDMWFSEKLSKQVAVLRNHPEYALVAANALVLVGNQAKNERYLDEAVVHSGAVLDKLIKQNFIVASSVLVRRSVLQTMSGFDPRPELKSLEDYDLWLRIACTHKICVSSEPLLYYRVHSNNTSRNMVQTYAGLVQCYDNLLIINGLDANSRRSAKRQRTLNALHGIKQCVREGRFRYAKKFFSALLRPGGDRKVRFQV